MSFGACISLLPLPPGVFAERREVRQTVRVSSFFSEEGGLDARSEPGPTPRGGPVTRGDGGGCLAQTPLFDLRKQPRQSGAARRSLWSQLPGYPGD